MVTTRRRSSAAAAATGDKRAAESPTKSSNKKAKQEEQEIKLDTDGDGQLGLKKEESKDTSQDETKKDDNSEDKHAHFAKSEVTGEAQAKENSKEADDSRGEDASKLQDKGQSSDSKSEVKQSDEVQGPEAIKGKLEEPKHGTLESGHVYFLYRPKIDSEEVDSLDDVSKFHILLIPKSSPYDKGHYHRILEVGRKHLPDPDAKRDIIWGMVGSVGTEQAALKEAFGAYSYETKTRGTRHQEAARPAARGHYILHSPRDTVADSPDHNKQRDFKLLLAYEITTPTHEDFGRVQRELDIAEKGAILIQVKNPDVPNTNPRAANFPKEKRADYPKNLDSLFGGRRFIPANPPMFLDYPGGELLFLTSPHKLEDSLGKDGEAVEKDLDKDAESEKMGIDEALKELGMSKKDTEIEALEGVWA